MTEPRIRSIAKVEGKRARTRARLVAATLEVAAEAGLAGASLEAIAARAGMTKGAIYSNFTGRADLLAAARASLSLNLTPPQIPGGDLTQHLRAVGEQLAALLPRAQGDARFVAEYYGYALSDPELRLRVAGDYGRMFAEIGAIFARDAGTVLTLPPEDFAVAVQSLALGLLFQSLMTPQAVTREVVLGAFTALAEGAVRR